MPSNPATALKDRLRADLKLALKASRKAEMSVLRTLLAAIDNAEAPPRTDAQLRYDPDSASEVDRVELSQEQLDGVLAAECDAREEAAAQLDRHGQSDRADALRAEVATIRRYLD